MIPPLRKLPISLLSIRAKYKILMNYLRMNHLWVKFQII